MPRGDHWLPWQERLAQGGLRNETTGCIEWARSKNSRGYGVIFFDGKLRLAHRAAWYAAKGAWPSPTKVLDHICNNKSCVNVKHLRELTNGENIQRAYPFKDAETERRRAMNRAACARYRAKWKTGRGESNSLV